MGSAYEWYDVGLDFNSISNIELNELNLYFELNWFENVKQHEGKWSKRRH